MHPRIKKLDNNLINRIAAGEVVERPASALKEILENSIDAQSTNIKVYLVEGGIGSIKVFDNGCGITQEDLPLAIDRHATSKIIQESDLYHIKTLGFRGEGLASIASISDFSVSSKTVDSDCGYGIIVSYGLVGELKPVAITNGTVVEVNGIYHNIPARKKFLKSSSTEYSHCKHVFERIALSHPEVNFEFYHNGKLIYKLAEESLLDRVKALFGNTYASNFIELIETTLDGIILTGYVYHPSYLESNKVVQQFYLNHRYVRDKVIQNAIKVGFSGVLHHEHQPQYVLFLELNPEDIDVNVHPTKIEVRFHDSGKIHSFISKAVRKVLASNSFIQTKLNNTPNNSVEGGEVLPLSTAELDIIPRESSNKENSSSSSFSSCTVALKSDSVNAYVAPSYVENIQPSLDRVSNSNQGSSPRLNVAPSTDLNVDEQYSPTEDYPENKPTKIDEGVSLFSYPLGNAIGIINGVFIISQIKDGMIIVDMHAAHERIVLERLKKQYTELNIIVQPLLIPIYLDVSEQHFVVAKEYHQQIKGLGVDISFDHDGQTTLVIAAIPALLGQADVNALVLSILNDFTKYSNTDKLEVHIEKILASMACHCAIRANHNLSVGEMNNILRDMESTSHTDYCNHGRPTWFKLTMHQLNAMFMRGK